MMRTFIIICGMLCIFTSTSCATVVVKQPKRVVVKRPATYKIVRVKGRKYYVWNGRYHRKTRKGYVFVKL